MRILHLIYDDLGNPWLGGGGAVRTVEINRRLAARGHQVVVLCGAYPGAPRSAVRGGALYLRVGGGGPGGYLGSRVRYALRAGALLKALPYDIVVEDFSPYSPVGAPWRARRGAAVVASVQNLSGRHAVRKYGWGARGLLPRFLERPLLRRFAYLLAVSQGVADEMRASGAARAGARIAVIPNSVGPQFAAAADLPVAPEEPVILFLGRIDPYQKGLDTLLRAYALAAPRLPGVRLEIAGSGPPAAEAQARAWAAAAGLPAQDSPPTAPLASGAALVVWRGKLEGAAAVDAMRHCLLLAMPSRYEAWPITALEAAICGRPVLGSDVTGVRDAAPAGAHGVLVPPDDAPAFAEALVALAQDAPRRAELGRRGRAWAAQFTWDALAARQEQFYRDAIAATEGASRGDDHEPGPA
jgi:glycogen synthase